VNLRINNSKILNLAQTLKNGDLAGLQSQLKAAPSYRKSSFTQEKLQTCRKASVLILLFPSPENDGDTDGEIQGVLIERSEYDGVHSKQIGFPGGEKDSDDIDDIHTAIRECKEEIGVDVKRQDILGPLTPLYIPPSNFLVTPYVAWLPSRPKLILDTKEVASTLIFKLSELSDDSRWRGYNVNDIMVPGIEIDKHLVWGATAMMLREFIDTFAK